MDQRQTALSSVKQLLSEADLLLSASRPPAQSQRVKSLELIRAAAALTDDLLKQDELSAAAVLGSRGGSETAKRGSDYFRQLASQRKTRAGGRPRKDSE